MGSYRELIVWQQAHQNLLDILEVVERFPQRRAAWEIERQLVRSASSIGANIAEGQGRQRFGRRVADCRSFYEIAYGSATETDNWLQVVTDLHWADDEMIKGIRKRNDEIMRMLYALIDRQSTALNIAHDSRLSTHD